MAVLVRAGETWRMLRTSNSYRGSFPRAKSPRPFNPVRPFFAMLLALVVVPPESFAFNSPLSDEAIREAYFLGQRRDESTARFLDKYRQHLAAPETGPYIASVELLTPFARVVLESSQQTVGYSAQQAEAEHRGKEEIVAMNIEVLLTDSYGPLIARRTGQRSGSPIGYAFRSPDFWRDIEVHVAADDRIVKATRASCEPTYRCSGDGGQLEGATLRVEVPARAVNSDTATGQVAPPEGPEAFVDFDLTAARGGGAL